jgi:hypothetical protein
MKARDGKHYKGTGFSAPPRNDDMVRMMGCYFPGCSCGTCGCGCLGCVCGCPCNCGTGDQVGLRQVDTVTDDNTQQTARNNTQSEQQTSAQNQNAKQITGF